MDEYGQIKIKITEIMKQKKLSKTRLAHLALLDRRQLNKLLDGTAARIDFAVLARICHALQCEIKDVLEYIPPDNT